VGDYRNNFHEDQLQHYVLKAQNLREDGGKVGCTPRKKASRKTLSEVLELGTCNESTRKRLLGQVGIENLDPVTLFLAKCDPETRERLRAVLQAA